MTTVGIKLPRAFRKRNTRIAVLVTAIMILGAALVQLAAYWPGLMTYDSVRQYDQALSGQYDDWHPPVFEWVWSLLLPIHTGPEPILLLQMALYWSGLALLAGWALNQRPGLAIALMVCGLMPLSLALTCSIVKDSLLSASLLSAAGLLACSQTRGGSLFALSGIALLLFAATLRFNAFLAGLPLLVAFLPTQWRNSRRRLFVTSVLASVPLLLALPLANSALGAQRSGVELSLLIFDLGGITDHSGVDVFPVLPVKDPVLVNHQCYSAVKWDPYAWWGPSPCRIGFDLIRSTLKASGQNPYQLWLTAIAAHPLAYAQHRLAHFNLNTRFLVNGQVDRPITEQSAPNPWGFQIHPNAVQATLDRAVVAQDRTPLGWPICWMAVALGVLVISSRMPSRALIVPLALSSLLYGMGYLVLSVAAEMRYHLWTILASLVAATIAGSDLISGARPERLQAGLAASLIAIVTMLALVARFSL